MITLPPQGEPNWVPHFSPLLAYNEEYRIEDVRLPVYVSPKLDGIRVLNLGSKGWVTRTGKEIPSQQAGIYLDLFSKLQYVDAELCLYNTLTKQYASFNDTQSIVMSDDKELPPFMEFRLRVFDWFGIPLAPFGERYAWLMKILTDAGMADLAVQQIKITDRGELVRVLETFCSVGEGAMLRCPMGRYKFGRSTFNEQYSMKYVEYRRIDGTVIGWEPNKVHASTRIGALIVLTEEYGEVKVGSGFDHATSYEMRHQFDEKWKGARITLKFKPFGMKDKPRQPIYVGRRHD